MKWIILVMCFLCSQANGQERFLNEFNLVNTAGTQYYKIMVDSVVLDDNYADWHTATRDAYIMARVSDGAEIVILHPPTVTRVEYTYAELDTVEVSPDAYESPLFYDFDWTIRQGYPITGGYTMDILAQSIADSVQVEVVCMPESQEWSSDQLTLIPEDGEIVDEYIGFCDGDLQVVIQAISSDKVYEDLYFIPLHTMNEE